MDSHDSDKSYVELLKSALTASLYDESAWHVVELSKREPFNFKRPFRVFQQAFRDWVIRNLTRRNLRLVEAPPFDPALREDGRDWPMFGFSMVGRKRLDNVEFCVRDVLARGIPGDFIETGAWRGGVTILMSALLKLLCDTQRKVWVADSFEGLPVAHSKYDIRDISHVQYLKVSLERVQANFKRFGLLNEQVIFLKGWFADTLPKAPLEKLAILRLDGDYYSSTMDVLNNLYFKVSSGGYVIVDDYGGWPECRRAVTEFLERHKLSPEIKWVDWTGVYWKVE